MIFFQKYILEPFFLLDKMSSKKRSQQNLKKYSFLSSTFPIRLSWKTCMKSCLFTLFSCVQIFERCKLTPRTIPRGPVYTKEFDIIYRGDIKRPTCMLDHNNDRAVLISQQKRSLFPFLLKLQGDMIYVADPVELGDNGFFYKNHFCEPHFLGEFFGKPEMVRLPQTLYFILEMIHFL